MISLKQELQSSDCNAVDEIDGTIIDNATWEVAYELGLREPRFTVPSVKLSLGMDVDADKNCITNFFLVRYVMCKCGKHVTDDTVCVWMFDRDLAKSIFLRLGYNNRREINEAMDAWHHINVHNGRIQ